MSSLWCLKRMCKNRMWLKRIGDKRRKQLSTYQLIRQPTHPMTTYSPTKPTVHKYQLTNSSINKPIQWQPTHPWSPLSTSHRLHFPCKFYMSKQCPPRQLTPDSEVSASADAVVDSCGPTLVPAFVFKLCVQDVETLHPCFFFLQQTDITKLTVQWQTDITKFTVQ